ncbi:hypothetical protein HDV01_007235 [Terramyces sp. JEL0728]|nr:hypothetical protein HDV01_007235 [Terramyces sp. JEL0728]
MYEYPIIAFLCVFVFLVVVLWIVKIYSNPVGMEYTFDLAGIESVFISPMSIYHAGIPVRNNYESEEPRVVVVLQQEKEEEEEDLPVYEESVVDIPPVYTGEATNGANPQDPVPYLSIYPTQ